MRNSNQSTGSEEEILEVCKQFCCLVVSLQLAELHICSRHTNHKINCDFLEAVTLFVIFM